MKTRMTNVAFIATYDKLVHWVDTFIAALKPYQHLEKSRFLHVFLCQNQGSASKNFFYEIRGFCYAIHLSFQWYKVKHYKYFLSRVLVKAYLLGET